MKSTLIALALALGTAALSAAPGDVTRVQPYRTVYQVPTTLVNQKTLQIISVGLVKKTTAYEEVESRDSDSGLTDTRSIAETEVVRVAVEFEDPMPSRMSDSDNYTRVNFDLNPAEFSESELATIKSSRRHRRDRAAARSLVQLQTTVIPVTRRVVDYSRSVFCDGDSIRCNDETIVYKDVPGEDLVLEVTR